MKYIKTYEEQWTPKYNVGDYVRIVGNNGNWKSTPFIIIKIGNITDVKKWGTQALNAYLLDDSGFKVIKSSPIWRKEDVLEFVPDYELKAIKYNL